MVTYNLTVQKQKICGTEKIFIAADSNKTVAFKFSFDRNWRLFDSKAAIFRNFEGKYCIVEITADRVTVPWEMLTTDNDFEMSVIAFEDETVLTSRSVRIRVEESLLPEDCKTLSPTETIFDRFKNECTAQAYLEYADEIREMEAAHEADLVRMGGLINEAKKETRELEAAKNAEIKTITDKSNEAMGKLNSQITELNAELIPARQKAGYWEMVNHALSGKLTGAQALWFAGNENFALPMMNTKKMTSLSGNNISPYLTEVGFDVTSISELSLTFSGKTGLRKVELKNTQNLINLSETFSGCSSLKSAKFGSLSKCSRFNRLFVQCACLETVEFEGTMPLYNADHAFNGCTALKKIIGTFDFTGCNSFVGFLSECTSLESITIKRGSICKAFDIKNCISLTKDSFIGIVEALNPQTPGELSVSRYNFEKNFPTAAEQEEIINYIKTTKNWDILLA